MATRERDAKGRFVKRTAPEPPHPMNDEDDSVHQLTRTYNRIADGGHEPSLEDARREVVLRNLSLKVLWAVLLLFLLWLALAGCGTKRVVEYVPLETVRTERVEVRDTVVEVQLVPYRDSVTVADSTSRIENDYAVSHAAVRGGLLSHSLTVKPGVKVGTPFRLLTYTRTDSVPYPVEVPGPTEYIQHKPSVVEYILMALGVIFLLLMGWKLKGSLGTVVDWVTNLLHALKR